MLESYCKAQGKGPRSIFFALNASSRIFSLYYIWKILMCWHGNLVIFSCLLLNSLVSSHNIFLFLIFSGRIYRLPSPPLALDFLIFASCSLYVAFRALVLLIYCFGFSSIRINLLNIVSCSNICLCQVSDSTGHYL